MSDSLERTLSKVLVFALPIWMQTKDFTWLIAQQLKEMWPSINQYYLSPKRDNSDESKDLLFRYPVALAAIVFSIWLLSGLLVNIFAENRGTFGDMFGAINALFTGLAFAGVIYTIYLQKIELKLQREELRATRDELKGQKEEMKIQNQTAQQQRFENTLFQLIELHQDRIKSMTEKENYVDFEGRLCFDVYYNKVYSAIKKTGSTTTDRENISTNYMSFYRQYGTKLGPYFSSLYQIIKLIDNSKMDNKSDYASLVRAQLSTHEQYLLFYHCLSNLGCEKFKPFVETYGLLKRIEKTNLPDEHCQLYNPTAFG